MIVFSINFKILYLIMNKDEAPAEEEEEEDEEEEEEDMVVSCQWQEAVYNTCLTPGASLCVGHWWLLWTGPVGHGETEVWGDGALCPHTAQAGGVWSSGELTIRHKRRVHWGTVWLPACTRTLCMCISQKYISNI